MIGCRDLSVIAGDREILRVDALDVAAGETLAVLGPNGAGKSTLLRALAGLGRLRRSGEVLLDGRPAAPGEIRAAVAAVLQRPVLQRGTVLDNAAAGLRLRGVRRREARRRAQPWLEALGVAHLAQRAARTLSGGETQRVAIARALAGEPRVLMLDEPFAGLDAATRTDLVVDLRAVLDELNAATLLVTHDRTEAEALADRVAVLIGGRIRQIGPTAQVLDTPADPDCARVLGYTTHLPPALTGADDLLVARPERCRPLPDGAAAPPGAIVVTGTVRRVVPLGGAVRVDLDTPAGPVSGLTTDEIHAASGVTLRIAVDPVDVRRCPTVGAPLARTSP